MRKLKKYTLTIHVLFLMVAAAVFSGCARKEGVLSYNSEKLRKQSVEIESDSSLGTGQDSNKTEEEVITASNSDVRIVLPPKSTNVLKEKTIVPAKKENKKTSLIEKVILKKLSRKLSPNDKAEAKRSNIDQKLKMAIIFGGIGVILFILDAFAGIFWVLGTIAIVIALVFLILWAVENL